MNELEIIIPAYNAHDTIKNTLDSVSIQKDLPSYHVTIVNDCGKDYKQIVDYYNKKLNIDELKTKENGGPGFARQYGIDNTKSKYLVFIDSDDYLYSEYSISNLYNKINNTQADLVISNFIYERDGEVIEKKNNTVWLHGKIYKREFLEKHNIRFNDTRANEDAGFNALVLALNPVIVLSNDITYVFKNNPNSITRRNNREFKLNGLEGYAYNINWAIEEAEKRNAPTKNVAWKAAEGLLVMYKNYNELYNDYDVEKIIKWSNNLYQKYQKYEEIIKEYEEQLIINANIKEQHISFENFKSKIKKQKV